MITALLQNYQEGGWMPKWPNPSYTNIMIGTHADSLVAEAMNQGFKGFNYNVAWDAAYKDAMTPPDGDTMRRWYDREPHTPYEARGGLTYSKVLGYVPADKTAEAASRTLEDSYDDGCVAQIAKKLGKMRDYEFFLKCSLNYEHEFNKARAKGRFALHAFVVMPEHVHLLLTPAPDVPLETVAQLIKGGFSFCLKSGRDVWERGYDSRRITDGEHFEACRRYIEDIL